MSDITTVVSCVGCGRLHTATMAGFSKGTRDVDGHGFFSVESSGGWVMYGLPGEVPPLNELWCPKCALGKWPGLSRLIFDGWMARFAARSERVKSGSVCGDNARLVLSGADGSDYTIDYPNWASAEPEAVPIGENLRE